MWMSLKVGIVALKMGCTECLSYDDAAEKHVYLSSMLFSFLGADDAVVVNHHKMHSMLKNSLACHSNAIAALLNM